MNYKTKALKEKYILDRGLVTVLTLEGPDAKDFLHRLSTVNFKKEFAGSLFGAFLNGQGKMIAMFTAWTRENKIHLFVEPQMVSETLNYLEKMHFAEDLKITRQEKYALEVIHSDLEKQNAIIGYNWGLSNHLVFADAPFALEKYSDHTILNFEDHDALRAAFGFAKPLKDLTTEHLFVESGLEDWVDRNKGCYPGQEVIEKIYTYGRLPRKILPVQLSARPNSDLPMNLLVNEENVGYVTSLYEKEGEVFGMATLKRLFLEKNKSFKNDLFELTWPS